MPQLTTLSLVGAGTELGSALRQLVSSEPLWIDGVGQIDDPELRLAAPGGDTAVRAHRGRFTLVRLAGPLQGPFMLMAVRVALEGVEVIAGELISARSAGVTLALCPAALAPSQREPTAPSPAAPAQATSTPAFAPPVAIPPKPMWARAAAASAAAGEDTEEEEEVFPDVGDWVDHFAFGLSEVVMSDGDRLRIRDAKDPGRVREVALGMLKVSRPTDEGGRRLFRLSRRGS